jgi:hypothetical protein
MALGRLRQGRPEGRDVSLEITPTHGGTAQP